MALDPSAHNTPPVDDPAASDPAGTDPAGAGGQSHADDPATPATARQLRAEARNWRLRHQETAKELAAEQARRKSLEDAGKTELERATSSAAEALKARETAELERLRLLVGATKGLFRPRADGSLDTTLAERLRGTTREELEADADELIRSLPQQSGGQQRPRVPNASPNAQGAAPGTSPSDWLRERLTGKAAG